MACKIVSIHSFRGGTGKSNVTANLAAQLALRGNKVGVVDTDIQSPGIHVLFGLDKSKMGHTLNEYLRGTCTMKEVAYPVGEQTSGAPGFLKLSGKPLWLIPSSIEGKEISLILRKGYDSNLLNKGLSEFRKEFNLDYMLIDTHPGLNEETLLSIALSNILIIVLRPDQQDFQGTAVTVDIANSLEVRNTLLIINKALLSRYDREHIQKQVEEKYQVPVAGVLPLSEDMADLGSSDIFTMRYPEHNWSKEFIKIVDRIVSIE
ncbi:MAG: MinD/ParA family protein [Anaerolineaceae bacterium]